MNRRPFNSLPLGKAITGFVNYKTAEGLSDRSVDSYKWILEHWENLRGNKMSPNSLTTTLIPIWSA
jgi:integrase/recombinase XerD